MRIKFLLLFAALLLLLLPATGGAWLIGDFQIPVKKVKPRPQPVVQPGSGASAAATGATVVAGAGSTFTEPATGMKFVWVPGGCFQMGSPAGEEDRDDDEGPVHKVCVDGFWMGKYEVTQSQWQKIMGNNPSYFKKGGNYPVEQVSWNDCQEFIKKLNRQGSHQFRLPTEAEWEYACRAGTTTPFYFGTTISADQANYDGTYIYGRGQKGVYRRSTVKVGSFSPNAFGLYDMHGNVWEWCSDWYGSNYYAGSPVQNPPGPGSGSYRVLRGGGRDGDPGRVRSANRFGLSPGNRDCLGFRLVALERR